jgi:predicted MFS family arabinose efflux permease
VNGVESAWRTNERRRGSERDYVLIWAGGTVSVLGSQVSAIAYPLLALALTGSATEAGLVGTVALAGQMLFRLPAGALVDRWDRRRAMLVTDALRCAVLGAVAGCLAGGLLRFSYLLVAALATGLLGEIFRPASTAAVRRVVAPQKMPQAVARFEAASYGAAVAGPPLGGALFSLGQALPFAADAISYAGSFACTWFVRSPMATGPTPKRNIYGQLTAGLRWVWGHRLVRTLLVSASAVSAIYTALTLAAIVAAKDHGATSTEVGLMLSIASGAGFLGALFAPRLSNHKKPSVVVLGIFWVTAAVVPLMALDQGPYVLGALLGAGTLLAPTANTILVSYQVTLTPDAIQGQVSNAAYFVAGALSPFAPLAAGLLVSHIGSARTLLVLGLTMALVALVATASRTMRPIPNFRQLVPA